MGTYALSTTDISEVISSLKKLHLPDQLVISVTVMARFFYTCSIDYRQIKNAIGKSAVGPIAKLPRCLPGLLPSRLFSVFPFVPQE